MNLTSNIPIKQFLKIFATLSAGVLLLSLVQIYNGYPLMLGDSLGYIVRAIKEIESSHWSNTYSVFILAIYNGFGSLQFVTLFQNIIVAITLFIFLKYVFPSFSHYKYLMVLLALLFTTLPWVSTLLMTDIFTPISFLSIFLLLEKSINKIEKFILFLFLFVGISVHQSHLMSLPLFILTLVIKNIFFDKSNSNVKVLISLILIIVIFVTSNLFQKNIINLIKEDKPKKNLKKTKTIQKADIYSGYYFMAVRMYESGQLEYLLEDFCIDGNKNYLCSQTPTADDEIRVKNATHHNRNENNKDYLKYAVDNKDFILFCLKKPRFYYGCGLLAFEKGLKLFSNTKIGYFTLQKYYKKKIRSYFRSFSKQELRSFKSSKQIAGLKKAIPLKIHKYAGFVWWKMMSPLLLILFIFATFKMRNYLSQHKAMIWCALVLIYGHFLNTMVCGTFSNYKNLRYSIKTLWLVNLAVILLIMIIIQVWRETKTNK